MCCTSTRSGRAFSVLESSQRGEAPVPFPHDAAIRRGGGHGRTDTGRQTRCDRPHGSTATRTRSTPISARAPSLKRGAVVCDTTRGQATAQPLAAIGGSSRAQFQMTGQRQRVRHRPARVRGGKAALPARSARASKRGPGSRGAGATRLRDRWTPSNSASRSHPSRSLRSSTAPRSSSCRRAGTAVRARLSPRRADGATRRGFACRRLSRLSKTERREFFLSARFAAHSRAAITHAF